MTRDCEDCCHCDFNEQDQPVCTNRNFKTGPDYPFCAEARANPDLCGERAVEFYPVDSGGDGPIDDDE